MIIKKAKKIAKGKGQTTLKYGIHVKAQPVRTPPSFVGQPTLPGGGVTEGGGGGLGRGAGRLQVGERHAARGAVPGTHGSTPP